MSDYYKLQKEAFVSNLNGGTVLEINLITLVAPISILLWSTLQAKQSFFTPYTYTACFVDFLLNCSAILLATTWYSAIPVLYIFLLLLPTTILNICAQTFKITRRKNLRPPPAEDSHLYSTQHENNPLPLKPFVTHYRGTMMVATCVAILAVDFKLFPRRFAKVENWGTSLMDLGVGSFVFSAGTVAARPILKSHFIKHEQRIAPRLKTAVRHALPLLVLGLIRLYSVKGLDYAEHVTEYGVHWNFFFTLALVSPFVAIFDVLFRILPSYATLALLLAGSYEVILNVTNLNRFIMTAPRSNFITKNREGIFSFIGYLAIFLAGQSTGMYILPRSTSAPNKLQHPLLQRLLLWSATWCTLYLLCVSYNLGLNLQVSRRLANLPYMLWVSAFNTCQLTLFCAIEAWTFPNIYRNHNEDLERAQLKRATSRLLQAFNRNGLAIFLIGNILTGSVNLSIPTLHIDDGPAIMILIAYIGLLSGIAIWLDWMNISIKL